MAEPSVARLLLQSARYDATACARLAEHDDVHDSVVGFHAQQAVEKALKAVLTQRGVAFRRTHDIAELLDLLADHRIEPPPHAERLDELNPFAVAARYGLPDVGPIDRALALEWVADAVAWTERLLADAGASDDESPVR